MRKTNFIIALLGLWLLGSCALIEEPNIEEEKIVIYVPRDGFRSELATQLFYWEEVPDAVEYELQLVTRNFDTINQFLLDTNIRTNKFEFTLSPGVYEWRLRAFNFSSTTPYTYHSLFIDSTSDLSNQKLILQSPRSNDTTNASSIRFTWLPLYNADSYELELWQPSIGQTLVFSENLSSETYSFTPSQEGAFEWRVRAQNQGSASLFESRAFFLDQTAPPTPSASLPVNGANLASDTITFQWSRSSSGGSSVHDTLYFAEDSVFSAIEKYYSTTKNLDLSGVIPGTYFWKVKSSDKAGNSSNFSNTLTFQKL